LTALAYAVWLAVLLPALRPAPWQALLANRVEQIYLVALLLLLLLWRMRAGDGPAASVHFLAVTTLTLMFGWRLSVVGASLVASTFLVLGGESVTTLPVSALASAIVPTSLSYVLYRLVSTTLPRNPFVFIFLCGFLGGVLSATANLLLKPILLDLMGRSMPLGLGTQPFAFLPLFAFPEGVLNGMLVTVLVALRPEWVRTYRAPLRNPHL
jgi:uncharacterized membrane protein